MEFESISIESMFEKPDDERGLSPSIFLLSHTDDFDPGIALRQNGLPHGSPSAIIEFTFKATAMEGAGDSLKQDIKAQLSPREKWANLVLPLQGVLDLGLGISEACLIPFDSVAGKAKDICRLMKLPSSQ